MPACARCGGRICKGEVKCFNCDLPVEIVKSGREIALEKFRLVLNILFFLFIGLTVASLFIDIGVKTAICAAATLILRLVRMSANEMKESKS